MPMPLSPRISSGLSPKISITLSPKLYTSDSDMSYCSTCRGLTITELDDNDIPFHDSLASLKASARRCDLCRLFWQCIFDAWPREVIEPVLKGRRPGAPGSPGMKAEREVVAWDESLWLRGDCGNDTPTVDFPVPNGAGIWISCGQLPSRASPKANDGLGLTARLSLYAMPGTSTSRRYRERFSTSKHDPGLNSVLGRKWYHECVDSHKMCTAAANPFAHEMPTRVIDVGDPKKKDPPRLIFTGPGMSQDYMALSYCWGNPPTNSVLTLNKKTMGNMLLSLNESKLAKVHQEALSVARALGFRYVWIDVLCIVQDEPVDWEYETRRMDRIYGNAALTVIAGRSSDVRTGFLASKLQQPVPPCAIPVTSSMEKKETLFAILPRSRKLGPAIMRGWCYQERLLSRRTLIFGEEQVYYQCRTGAQYEDGESTINGADGTIPPTMLAQFPTYGDPVARRDQALKQWYEIVRQYTSRRVTNPHDVFTAIASVAAQTQSALGSRYLAGVWDTDLPRGLLWKPRYQVQGGPFPPNKRPPPTKQAPHPVIRAPSWSWATVDGPVAQMYDERLSPLFEEPGYVKIRPKNESYAADDELCDVGSLRMPTCELEIVGKLALGTSTALPVEEHLPTEKTQWSDWVHPYSPALLRKYGFLLTPQDARNASLAHDLRTIVAVGAFDVPGESYNHNFWCLQITPTEGIILRKMLDESGHYRRIGWFLLEAMNWFDTVKETTIRLV